MTLDCSPFRSIECSAILGAMPAPSYRPISGPVRYLSNALECGLRTLTAALLQMVAPVEFEMAFSWSERRSRPVAATIAADESAGLGGVSGALKSLQSVK